MAKLKAPLFSFDARGSLAKSIVFGRWHSVNYARQHVVPSNPRSADQVSVRNNIALLNTEWHNAERTHDDRLGYTLLARQFGRMHLGWNEFVRIYQPILNTGGTPLYFRGGTVTYSAGTYSFTINTEADTEVLYIIRNAQGVFVAQGTITSDETGKITLDLTDESYNKGYTIQVVENANKPRSESGLYKFPSRV